MEMHLAATLRIFRQRKEGVWRPSRFNPTLYLNGPRPLPPPPFAKASQCLQAVNPRVLGRVMDVLLAREDPTLRHRDPPLLRVAQAVPDEEEEGRAPCGVAWKHWGVPLLVRRLGDARGAQRDAALRALLILGDLLHDEQLVPSALAEGVTHKLAHLLLDKNPWVRDRSLQVLACLARTPVGRDKMLTSRHLLKKIKVLMLDEEDAVRLRAASLLHRLVLPRLSPFDLDEHDLALYLFTVLDWEEMECVCQLQLWNIQMLLVMQSTREACIEAGALDVLHRLKSKLTDDRYLKSVSYILTKDDPKKYAVLSKKPTVSKRFDQLSIVSEKTEHSAEALADDASLKQR